MYEDVSRTVIVNWIWQSRFILYLVILAWVISILNFGLLDSSLNRLGIRPRSWSGLVGIVFAPFLHGSWEHLEGNTIAFLSYGGLILLHNPADFGAVTVTVALSSGLGTWLLGRPPNHIGASGVTFGYLGFLFSLAFFDRSIPAILLLTVTAIFYSNRLWGLLPFSKRVSWEEHLFGFMGGIYAAQNLPVLKHWFDRTMGILGQISG
jgi:membrane associated rhomboid family serine protease